ncbi:MAG: efflux RND transporter periplasmic adaptor subunit, partial [Erythrobacter sp.]|nr:efflux RND transporter periplasmic adaptor subunit [Erythrobacter sp.]
MTPPDPVPAVAPEKAAGLVPVSEEVKSKLETKVDGFVEDLLVATTGEAVRRGQPLLT